MAREAAASGVTDPLSGLTGPSLFPRTFKVSAGFLTPSDPKDLDSIHSLMRSLELRSPEKLMNEAKRIVDSGAELLESYHSSLFKNVGTNDATHAKGKDKPQERRPGLGLVRKRALFSLKTNTSQPTVTRKNNVDLDSIDDPDEYFDAYERMEKANKEIQKQLGGNVDKFSLYNPSNNERRRRPGILGKTYTYKHRFAKGLSENDVSLMSLQEIADADNPRSHEENSQKADEENILSLPEDYVPKVAEEDIPGPPEDPNPDSNLEEVELAGSMKNTENEYSNILQEVLSFNYEDLQGHGALNLLQERLNIKPLDIENLGMTKRLDVGMRKSIFTVPETESHHKSVRNSLAIDRALKNLNRKPTTEHKQVLDPINHVSTPTPPRSPFASMSTLRKQILQPNPLGDPFSPMDVELSKTQSAFAVRLEDKLSGRVNAPADLGMYNELESPVNVVNMEPLVFNVDAPEGLGNTDGLPKLLVDDNGGLQNAHNNSKPFEEHGNDFDRTMNVTENESNPSVLGEEARDDMLHTQQTVPEQQPEIEPLVFNVDAQEDLGNTDGLPKLLVDENAGLPNAHDNSRPFEEHDNDFDRTMNVNKNESNPSILEVETRDDMSSSQQTDTEQPHEEYQTKHPRRTRAAGEKRIRKYHPMRKSLADAGTSLETGVRRSRRVKMRALEYWRGERFLYGRVDDSLKLIGVKYMSPGKGNENLKVKPYISSESSKFQEFLEMEAC